MPLDLLFAKQSALSLNAANAVEMAGKPRFYRNSSDVADAFCGRAKDPKFDVRVHNSHSSEEYAYSIQYAASMHMYLKVSTDS